MQDRRQAFKHLQCKSSLLQNDTIGTTSLIYMTFARGSIPGRKGRRAAEAPTTFHQEQRRLLGRHVPPHRGRLTKPFRVAPGQHQTAPVVSGGKGRRTPQKLTLVTSKVWDMMQPRAGPPTDELRGQFGALPTPHSCHQAQVPLHCLMQTHTAHSRLSLQPQHLAQGLEGAQC